MNLDDHKALVCRVVINSVRQNEVIMRLVAGVIERFVADTVAVTAEDTSVRVVEDISFMVHEVKEGDILLGRIWGLVV